VACAIGPKSELIIIIDFVEVFTKVPMSKMWHVNFKIKKTISPSVNTTLTTKLNCEQPILTLKLISNDKSYSRFYISPHVSSKNL
jgi:hypothetical protein